MEFRQLEAYVAVYELESFSKAAKELFISQPSVSAYITSLEKELDTQLILRSAREFIPTEAGTALYRQAKNMISIRDNALCQIRELNRGKRGKIQIYASSVPAQYILPVILGSFHKLHPDIRFDVQQTNSLEAIEAVSSYKCEVGLVGGMTENPNCHFYPFLSERLVLITPNFPEFSGKSRENLQKWIGDTHFITRSPGSGTRILYEESLEKIGISPDTLKISARMRDTQIIIQAVAGGLGISIVSELAVCQSKLQESLRVIPLPFLPERTFYVVLNRHRIRSAITDRLVTYILEQSPFSGA